MSVRDGATGGEGRIWGCYLHGLFENEPLRRAWLSTLGWQVSGPRMSAPDRYESAFERLADVVEDALDVGQLDAIVGGPVQEVL